MRASRRRLRCFLLILTARLNSLPCARRTRRYRAREQTPSISRVDDKRVALTGPQRLALPFSRPTLVMDRLCLWR
jgi:hypothetical protein